MILTALYPPLGFSGHDERCRQTVSALARLGHRIQILTSNHRLPPMGVSGEKGVYRECRLHDDLDGDSQLGHSFQATYTHERYNAEVLEYRLLRFQPDVVYVWNMNGLSKSLLFQLQQASVKVVYDLHSDWLLPEYFERDPWYRWWFENSSLKSRIYRLFIRSFGKARRVQKMLPIFRSTQLNLEGSYVISEWLQTELLGGGFAEVDQLPVIYPAIEPTALATKTRYAKCYRFLWAGRLSEHKGADIAVDAVGILKSRGIEVTLDLFGMGKPKERKAKRQHIEDAGLIDQVTMRGIRPGELSQYYARYDALLYTSRGGEPFSMTVLEALLSKLPCLVARAGGNQELLRDNQDALLFEAGDAEALADAMVRFLERDDQGRDLAESSIERLQAAHTIDNFCQQILPILSFNR